MAMDPTQAGMGGAPPGPPMTGGSMGPPMGGMGAGGLDPLAMAGAMSFPHSRSRKGHKGTHKGRKHGRSSHKARKHSGRHRSRKR